MALPLIHPYAVAVYVEEPPSSPSVHEGHTDQDTGKVVAKLIVARPCLAGLFDQYELLAGDPPRLGPVPQTGAVLLEAHPRLQAKLQQIRSQRDTITVPCVDIE